MTSNSEKEMVEGSEGVIQGNKLIVEFMGIAPHELDENYYKFKMEEVPLYNSSIHHKDKLQYHISWDWIMPVVEKINSLPYNESNNRFQPSVERFLENDIASIWNQVVSFIKYHNQLNNK